MTFEELIKALEDMRYHLTASKHKALIDDTIDTLRSQNAEIKMLYTVIENEQNAVRMWHRQAELNADSIIKLQAEIERLKKANLQKKCGNCIYAKPTTFGRSKVYVECTNAEHLKIYCRNHHSAKIRTRTNPACKSYVERQAE